jgi:hypothetical protein
MEPHASAYPCAQTIHMHTHGVQRQTWQQVSVRLETTAKPTSIVFPPVVCCSAAVHTCDKVHVPPAPHTSQPLVGTPSTWPAEFSTLGTTSQPVKLWWRQTTGCARSGAHSATTQQLQQHSSSRECRTCCRLASLLLIWHKLSALQAAATSAAQQCFPDDTAHTTPTLHAAHNPTLLHHGSAVSLYNTQEVHDAPANRSLLQDSVTPM